MTAAFQLVVLSRFEILPGCLTSQFGLHLCYVSIDGSSWEGDLQAIYEVESLFWRMNRTYEPSLSGILGRVADESSQN